MKLSSSTTTYLSGWLAVVALATIAAPCHAGRGSQGPLQFIQRHRQLQGGMGMDGGGGGGGGGGGVDSDTDPDAPLLEDQCYICGEPDEEKIRPTSLTVQYQGGTGQISRYQTIDKADCQTQDFPVEGTVTTSYNNPQGEPIAYDVFPGAVFTIINPQGDDGGELEAFTTFTFSNGVSCFIHTSCSQPLVGGDVIGPFLLLEGNDCVFSYCGDGVVDEGEQCDEGESMPSATCRENCTIPICGDGIVDIDMGEECDEGSIMPTPDCRNCTIPFCGDGILDVDMGEDCDDGANGIDTDGCRDDCTVPFCGDNIIDMGEACDDGANGIDTDGCRDNCTVPFCGDNVVDMGEECDDGANGDDTDGCRDDCTIPFCGDSVFDPDMGEECDEGESMPTTTCDNCTIPFCGNGILEYGEECDDGANGDDSDGCKDDCTTCVCEASPTYDVATGAVTIAFDMCGQDPVKSDWIGIYRCEADTFVADQDWWNNTVCKQWSAACGRNFDEEYGYVEGEEYVDEAYLWFSRTCGSPVDNGCQTDPTFVWPSSGVVTIDPTIPGANWSFGFNNMRTLEPGCYKAILQREIDFISPPPYPTICGPWGDALEFTVPSPNMTTEVTPLTADGTTSSDQSTSQSGSLGIFTLGLSTFFVSLASFLVLYLGN